MTGDSGRDCFCMTGGLKNDAIQATWEYLYKVVMLSCRSLERIDKFCETHSDAELPAYRAEVRGYTGHVLLLLDGFVRTGSVGTFLFSGDEGCGTERAEGGI